MRSERKIGALLSYVYIFVHSFATLIYTPFLLKYLGQSEYGLYSLSISILSYLSMLDLGFGNSMIRFISKYKSLNKKDEEKLINGLFLIFYSIIGLLVLVLGFILYKNTDLLFASKFTSIELQTIKTIIIILIVNVAITFPLSLFGSYIISSEKFIFQKSAMIIKTILFPVILILILKNGFKSIGVVILMSVLNLLINIANMIYCKTKLNIQFTISKKCFKYIKEVFNYSFFIFLAIIVDNVYNNTDQIILGSICGTVVVSVYGLANQIKLMYEQMSTAISGVFLPKVVSLVETQKDNRKISDLFIRISRIQMIILFLILFGFIVFGREFILLWSNKSYIDAYYIVLILIAPATVPLTQNIALLIAQAKNKHKFRSILYIFIALINIIISIPLSKLYGAIGAAIGSAVCLIIGHIIIMNFYYNNVIKVDIKTYWKNFSKIALVIGIYSFIVRIIIANLIIKSWLLFICLIILYSIIYLVLIYILFLNKGERKYIKHKIYDIVYNLTPKFIIKDYIIFESNPDMTDNTRPVYDMFLKNNDKNNFKLVWFVDEPKDFKHIKENNVRFVKIFPKTLFGKIKKLYYNMSAKAIIDCNKYVHKLNKHQFRIHLTHGIGYKNVVGYQSYIGKTDYITVTGNYFNDTFMKGFNTPIESIIDLGYPRNDILVNKSNKNIKELFGLEQDSKMIIWLPTYRNHKNIKNKEKKYINDLGIPVFNSIEELEKLNEYLKNNNMYIILKPHPVEDVSLITKNSFTNFKIILDEDLSSKNIILYELLSISDSLITDYSSVYFDYLLMKKPIGVTLDSYVKGDPSLIVDDYEKVIGGEHIKTIDDFYNYLNIVKTNKISKKYLKELSDVFTYADGNSTKRIYDFIMKKIKR